MNRESGFTLIEALIAMLILIFGLVAVANLFVVAASSNQIGNYTTVSTATASDVMEKLKAIPFSQLVLASAPYTAADPWNVEDWNDDDFSTAQASAPDCGDVAGLAGDDTCNTQLPGVGTVVTHWKIIDPGAGGIAVRYILVRSEVRALLGRSTRAQFSTFRVCVASTCP